MSIKNDKKNGFTLAEVLIILGIIGVVSAITMPTLIKHYEQHKTVNQLKKVYTMLNQAFKMSVIDNDSYENWDKPVDIGINAYYKKYWKPYLKVVKQCKTLIECGYLSNTPWVNANNTKKAAVYGDSDKIVLNDGTLLIFGYYDNVSIHVDLNGKSKPNKYGRDYFTFHIRPDGAIGVGNISNTRYCSKDHTGGDNGEYCAEKIITDGWKIKSDYPW